MGIVDKLMKIQTEIKAPKNLYNSFGKYKYRNAEGICEAVKPYLIKNACALILTDSVIEIGNRIYIKATATIMDTVDGNTVEVSAMAREAEDKKGMDDSQITGTASSYARKYALNGLFLLDDTKDADSDEYHEQTSRTQAKEQHNEYQQVSSDCISEIMVESINKRINGNNKLLNKILELYKVDKISNLNNSQAVNLNTNWDKLSAMVE